MSSGIWVKRIRPSRNAATATSLAALQKRAAVYGFRERAGQGTGKTGARNGHAAGFAGEQHEGLRSQTWVVR